MATYAELREKYVNGQGKEQQTKKREAPDNAQIVAGARQYLAQHQAENAGKWASWQEAATARDNASAAARAAEEAQKKYDEYLLTDEAKSYVRQNQAAKGAQMMQGAGISTPYAAGMQQQAAPQKDQKAESLKAERDRLKEQADIAADNVTRMESEAAINALSADDMRHLEDYVAQRSTAQVSNLFSGVMGTGPQFDTYNMNPLVQKYGIGKVRQMAETYERMQNEKTAQEVAESTAQALEGKTGIGHNIASIGANVIGGTVATLGRGLDLANRTGQYHNLQEHTAYDAMNIYGSTVRQETA